MQVRVWLPPGSGCGFRVGGASGGGAGVASTRDLDPLRPTMPIRSADPPRTRAASVRHVPPDEPRPTAPHPPSRLADLLSHHTTCPSKDTRGSLLGAPRLPGPGGGPDPQGGTKNKSHGVRGDT